MGRHWTEDFHQWLLDAEDEMKPVSCGRNMGHNLSCTSDYQCDQCIEIEFLTMECARKDAQRAVYMGAIAFVAKQDLGPDWNDWCRDVVKRADEAARGVKRDHLVTAKLNRSEQ